MTLGQPSLAARRMPENAAQHTNADNCSYVDDSDGSNEPINTHASAYIKKVHDRNQSEHLVSDKLEDCFPPPPPSKFAM